MEKPNLNIKVAKAKAWLEMKGYNVAYIGIYGSQNYGLDVYTEEYTSDIDYKAVIIPTLDDLVFNSKPKSTTLEYEGGQIDLKDVRVFMTTLCKCNPAYIETLYTPYCWYSEDYAKIINMKEELVSEMGEFLMRASYGMIMEKVKAFSHPYPSLINKIEKYGYDPKQLHHIVRLYLLMENYAGTGKFIMENTGSDVDILMDIKLGKHSLEQAEKLRDNFSAGAWAYKDNYNVPAKFKAKEIVLSLSLNLVKNAIIEEIKGTKSKKSQDTTEFNKLPNM